MYRHIYEFVNEILFIFITNKKLFNIVHKVVVQTLTGFWMSLMYFRIQISPFMKESVSFHHSNIYTGLVDLAQMLLPI